MTTRPVDRAEKALRGLVAAAVPVVASLVLAEVSTVSASALVIVPVLIVAGGVVVARRSGGQQAALSETGGATELGGLGIPAQPLPLLCRWLKRSVDVVVAGTVLVLGLPVLAFAAVAIAVEGRGGVLFSQTRVGCNGRRFRMYKLRTMRPANDEGQHRAYVAELIRGEGRAQDGMYKLVADDRRTRVGRVLRSFSIDELPQLWNVLRGDMSVVGPRPPLPAEVALYDEAAWARMAVNPGLTGLWQVSGRSRLSFQEMVELDVRYWQEWSPLLDLRILLRTPKAVLWGRETA
ncbi:MAG TPA: sugar transferase [Acidimicrobiales bacterium]|nr:sugar transferase [Acidimicrobiales bacterium]